MNDEHVKDVDAVREQFWQLYHDLKAYKLNPMATQTEDIKSHFQAMCSAKTAYATLNQALKRMGKNQHKLLRVFDKPYLPPHNNLSEQDIRDYVRKRKISGSLTQRGGASMSRYFASKALSKARDFVLALS